MSENTEKNNNFQLIDKITSQHFSEIEHNIHHFQQILFDLQNEYYKIWKNSFNSNLSLFKEFTSKSKYDYSASAPLNSIISNLHEEATKYRDVCNKIVVSTIEASKKNAKTWNDHAKSFEESNKKIIQFWMSAFTMK
ncbi:MAG: hypothetical protein HOK63_06915 [Thaumarchaeota archaeon]|jgi:hypothetical protein|nr:hypothetical protein [Nitrososphaerota archaeon]MBT5842560.1 hypothetical protein [Nitrososphaerota archaeon]MBT6469358.1 hypothetical protein [Nitrososphaerota archaeon]